MLLLASFAGLAGCSPGEPPPPPPAPRAAAARPVAEVPVVVRPAPEEAVVIDYSREIEETRAIMLEGVKKITLLDPDEFPEAPPGLRRALKELGCLIPQSLYTYMGDPAWGVQDNLLPGHFKSSAEIHWAVLCTRSEQTSLLIFDSLGQNMETLVEPQDNVNLLEVTYSNEQADFFWYTRITEESRLAEEYAEYEDEFPTPALLALEGLVSGSDERSATYFYWNECEWVTLETGC